MNILNLGCQNKTNPNVINIDFSIYLKIRKSPILFRIAPLFIGADRLIKLYNLPDNIIVHDLSKGIPFPSNSVDVVYHSHFMEHLDRNVAISFLAEVMRVLRDEGVHRIVVPDFEKLCLAYIDHVNMCDTYPSNIADHDNYIADIIEQCVMTEAPTTAKQPPFYRFLENLILGDARKRGLTHQWMYDRVNLTSLLGKVGFREVNIEKYNTSSIANWDSYMLDLDEAGNEYKPRSLYIEAVK
jgi:hypothetical protein